MAKIYPQTTLGKFSFWLTMLGGVLMYIPYWLAMATQKSSPPFLAISAIALTILFGVTSIFSIVTNKDRAVLLYISSVFGALGVLLIVGEFVFPH